VSFLNVLFPACPSFGITSEPRYSVSVITRASGIEKRNRNWDRVLHRYTVTVGPRAEQDISELLEFWHVVGAQAYSFRFLDRVDEKSCRIESTVTALDQPLVSLGGNDYQLTKRYTFPTYEPDTSVEYTQDREITKPIEDTIIVANGSGTVQSTSNYSVDSVTGVLTKGGGFSGTPTTWGGHFHTICRFESELPIEIVNKRIQSASFTLVEVRDEDD